MGLQTPVVDARVSAVMTITFRLTVFRWRITTFDVRIDIDEGPAVAAQPAVVNTAIKRVSRRWAARMI